MNMIRKIFFVLLLLATAAYATPASEYMYKELASDPHFAADQKVEEGFSFDVNFASLLGAVDDRFEKEYLVNAPKRVNPITPFITLSYRF